ncbi:ATP-binding protein [Algirhabdus cladophorae]|uniref:ATP-binding protein n=1 Tax=Algirhabdus cladophorae TaxID=3377108 RepID=UPI003B845B5F
MKQSSFSVSVTLAPHLDQMQIVRDALDSLMRANGISATATARMQIVLDELLSNVINHGFADLSAETTGDPISVSMRIKDAVFSLTIQDQGTPFDPTNSPKMDDKTRPRIGGRGLDMVRALTDSFSHHHDDGSNHTVVTKTVQQDEKGNAPMIAGLEIQETRQAGAANVQLIGRIDSGNAAQLTDHLIALVAAGHKEVTLDMSKLSYLTSAGFRTLLVVSDAAEEAKGELILAFLTEEVKELFDLSGLTPAFIIRSAI